MLVHVSSIKTRLSRYSTYHLQAHRISNNNYGTKITCTEIWKKSNSEFKNCYNFAPFLCGFSV